MNGRRWWIACVLVFLGSLAALVPTTGDFGLTWDEPAYRYSQELSQQWWQRLARSRSKADIEAITSADALLYYWPYGRYGINFHPPLAGQLNLLTYGLFGSVVKDIPARRMASVFEFALTITILFGFLSRRYGAWVGGVAAGSLLLMPRLYGQAHLVDTDTPGLLLWAASAVAFWKGLHEPNARRWRIAVGVLLGLAFVEKMGAVMVLLPIFGWLIVTRLPRAFSRRDGAANVIDGLVTSALMLAPLAVAFLEIRRLAKVLPLPNRADLFIYRPDTALPGLILLTPLAVWLVRRLIGRFARSNKIWGAERPALETWTAILAFAPAVSWLGNPEWWREALPRLAHYYSITTARRGVLPDIQILYFGQTYEYSLPWHNAWVLMGITVPVAILAAGLVGLWYAFRIVGRDRLPVYFFAHLATLPVMRMLPTPAHDGVRLFLPSFFFLAAFAGWGLVWLADRLKMKGAWLRSLGVVAVLGSAAWQLIAIHPYELSYYNEAIGGPKGAWKRGFELSYWYDALNLPVLEKLDLRLPPNAAIEFSNEMSMPVMVVQDLQALGELRRDIQLGAKSADTFPFMWLLTQDSKADGYTRLLYGMRPWLASRPSQLGGVRVMTVADPIAVSRAWALQILLGSTDTLPPDPPAAPRWIGRYAPPLARLWGDGVTKVHRLVVNDAILKWSRNDPDGFRLAAIGLSHWRPPGGDSAAWASLADRAKDERELFSLIVNGGLSAGNRTSEFPRRFRILMASRPEALVDAAEILIAHGDEARAFMMRYPYTDPESIGGYLDRDLPPYPIETASRASSAAEIGRRPTYPKTTQAANAKARTAIPEPSQ